MLQEMSFSSADGVSRFTELQNVMLATPKLRLFVSLKHGNASASSESSLQSMLHNYRALASLKNGKSLTMHTCTADPQTPDICTSEPSTADTCARDSHTANVTVTLPVTTVAASAEQLLLSDEDEACAEHDNCFRNHSTSQQR